MKTAPASVVTGVRLENVRTGRLALRVHALRPTDGTRATLCGLSIFVTNPAVQFSVEEHEPVNCPHCKERLT